MSKKSFRKTIQAREDLAGEHRYGDLGQLILLAFFLIIWILDSFIFDYSTFLTRYISNYIRIPVAVIIFLISGYLANSGLKIIFIKKRETPHVITENVFSIVRHPIYLASILVYLGWIICTLSLLSLAFWFIIITFYYYISKYEERLLEKKFGSEYTEYKRKVPMLIPWFRRK